MFAVCIYLTLKTEGINVRKSDHRIQIMAYRLLHVETQSLDARSETAHIVGCLFPFFI